LERRTILSSSASAMFFPLGKSKQFSLAEEATTNSG
jgi:hypothetical protein